MCQSDKFQVMYWMPFTETKIKRNTNSSRDITLTVTNIQKYNDDVDPLVQGPLKLQHGLLGRDLKRNRNGELCYAWLLFMHGYHCRFGNFIIWCVELGPALF